MELRTQAVDRILETLAPAIAAEIERLMQEHRQAQQQLEEAHRQHLEQALRDTEQAILHMAEVRQGEAVAAAREETRNQIAAELQAQFTYSLQQMTSDLQSQFAQREQAAQVAWAAERAHLQEQVHQWYAYADAQRQFAESGSQAEMLTRFLNLAAPFAHGLSVYLVKAGNLALWKSRGGFDFPTVLDLDRIDAGSYFKPVQVRERTVAAVCASRPYKAEPLDFLAAALSRSIEAFGLKLRTSVLRPAAARAPAFEAADTAAQPASPAPVPPMDLSGPAPDATPEPDRAMPDESPVTDSDESPAEVSPAMNAEKLHADARLSAKLLVSEIKLYNDQEVRDGRAHSDLYRRLEKTIEQARAQYRMKLNGASLGQDYFHDELVRVLAEGDADRLGPAYPGPLPS